MRVYAQWNRKLAEGDAQPVRFGSFTETDQEVGPSSFGSIRANTPLIKRTDSAGYWFRQVCGLSEGWKPGNDAGFTAARPSRTTGSSTART